APTVSLLLFSSPLRSVLRYFKFSPPPFQRLLGANPASQLLEKVPPEYSTTLSSLQDKAVPCDFKAIKEVIVHNLGQELLDM
ncbi:hypothetical protein IFM89_002056, partial [Coptis chinensis]